ncbi:Essential protein Yae1, N-terminal [Dillenia turbinata]|uniref:Essential protein Yae1, N-terminal n=1 Tax=Dillenia turbinata TaxID=194707 RepID=A0AAN8V790_9MAGN
MMGSLSEELYSSMETLHLSNTESNASNLTRILVSGFEMDGPQYEDGSLFSGSNEEVDKSSDLDREWQRRQNQFHMIGYRDGLLAGKEASAQEGFNVGFKDSVLEGYNLGLVRGITSVFACLPDGLKEKLVEKEENQIKLQHLYECFHSLSATDALKLFHLEVLAKKSEETSESTQGTSTSTGLQCLSSSDPGSLRNCYGELKSILSETSSIKMQPVKSERSC